MCILVFLSKAKSKCSVDEFWKLNGLYVGLFDHVYNREPSDYIQSDVN